MAYEVIDGTWRWVPRRLRVVPHVNSWNIAGWCVEDYWPICMVWSRCTRLYLTRWGARRAQRRMERGH